MTETCWPGFTKIFVFVPVPATRNTRQSTHEVCLGKWNEFLGHFRSVAYNKPITIFWLGSILLSNIQQEVLYAWKYYISDTIFHNSRDGLQIVSFHVQFSVVSKSILASTSTLFVQGNFIAYACLVTGHCLTN